MLESTFQLFRGIQESAEKELWEAGIRSWDDVLHTRCPTVLHLSNITWRRMHRGIQKFQKLLLMNDYNTLGRKIPEPLVWRAIPNYQRKIAYLDIETTGLSYRSDQITTIAVYDGTNVKTFVQGKNLGEFKNFIRNYPAIATFYGKDFDVPFIRSYLGCEMRQLHFDVCFLLKRLGIYGSLKKIEKQLDISRREMTDLDGRHAVLLWERYKATRNEEYLETLLAYNVEDVLNLEYLLNYTYNELSRLNKLPVKAIACANREFVNPFKTHNHIITEIKDLASVDRF